MPGAAENATKLEHRLAEALPGLLVVSVAPQERHQRVAGVNPAGAEREIGEQGLRLAGGQRSRAGVGAEQEATQEPKAELRHSDARPVAPALRVVKHRRHRRLRVHAAITPQSRLRAMLVACRTRSRA